MKRWIVVPCVTPHIAHDYNLDHVALVVSEDDLTEEEAAARGVELLEREDVAADEPAYFEHVYVIPFDPDAVVACRSRRAYERAEPEWQCCGGPIGMSEDGHSGFCPKHSDEDE